MLYAAQKEDKLASTGPYRYIRHSQCLAFILSMVGFLLQWPTILTVLMFPVLVVVYVKLAHREEQEIEVELGDTWRDVAIARSWHERYGAELVANWGPMLQFVVTRPPATEVAAWPIAREHLLAAADTIQFPWMALRDYARGLVGSDRWFLLERP